MNNCKNKLKCKIILSFQPYPNACLVMVNPPIAILYHQATKVEWGITQKDIFKIFYNSTTLTLGSCLSSIF